MTDWLDVKICSTALWYIGKHTMTPIYYFRYWRIKYPVLDKLKAEPGAAADGRCT